jgi:hypothetical protein
MGLSTGATSQDDAAEKFFVGRMIIRQAKEEFGIYPGNDEISAYLKTLRVFAGPDQNSIQRPIGILSKRAWGASV